MTEFKEMIEWLIAPLVALMLWTGKVLHGHSRWIGKHETAIALLVNGHEAEQEKRTEQRAEMIETLKTTDRKIDDLASKFNKLLIELASNK